MEEGFLICGFSVSLIGDSLSHLLKAGVDGCLDLPKGLSLVYYHSGRGLGTRVILSKVFEEVGCRVMPLVVLLEVVL